MRYGRNSKLAFVMIMMITMMMMMMMTMMTTTTTFYENLKCVGHLKETEKSENQPCGEGFKVYMF